MTKSSSIEAENTLITPLSLLDPPDKGKKADQKSVENHPDLHPFLIRGSRPLKKSKVAGLSQSQLVSSDQTLNDTARSEKKRQTDADLSRSSEPPPLFDPPVIPPPEVDKPSSLEPEKRNIEQISQDLESKKTSPFGLPFKHSSGSEIGLACHPQMILAASLEDCTKTMIIGRDYTTKTIVESDLVKREEINKRFEEKLKESLEIAKSQQQLSYIEAAVSCLNSAFGLAGGASIMWTSVVSGSGLGVLCGLGMTAGGMCTFGSFLLRKFGYENSYLSPLMALGVGLTLSGGWFSAGLDSLGGYISWAISLAETCVNVKEGLVEADRCNFSGDMTTLQEAQKSLADEIRKHFGDLDVSAFNGLFKVAIETDEQLSELSKKVVQATLKG